MSWFSENAGTIAVTIVLIAIVAAIIRKMIKDRKQGKSPCGCSCSGCSGCASCAMRTTCKEPSKTEAEPAANTGTENSCR